MGSGLIESHFLKTMEIHEDDWGENSATEKLWAGLKQDDKISIKIRMHEDDDMGDSHYGENTFVISVADIAASINPQGFYDKTDLEVSYGGNWLNFTFRFTPRMRHTSK